MDGAIKTPPRPIWQAQHERRLNVAEAILMALGRPLPQAAWADVNAARINLTVAHRTRIRQKLHGGGDHDQV